MIRLPRRVAVLPVLLMWAASAHASLGFHVALNTTPLVASVNGPFTIDVQLNDGSGIGDGNNTAVLDHFVFSGGNAIAGTTTFGGVSGDLDTEVTLVDDSFFNDFEQSFVAGSQLAFDVVLTTNVDAGITPDAFSIALLDGSGVEIPTAGFGSPLLQVFLDSTPSVETFSATGDYAAIGAPTISAIPAPTGVPEPETGWLLVFGFVPVMHRRLRSLFAWKQTGHAVPALGNALRSTPRQAVPDSSA